MQNVSEDYCMCMCVCVTMHCTLNSFRRKEMWGYMGGTIEEDEDIVDKKWEREGVEKDSWQSFNTF